MTRTTGQSDDARDHHPTQTPDDDRRYFEALGEAVFDAYVTSRERVEDDRDVASLLERVEHLRVQEEVI